MDKDELARILQIVGANIRAERARANLKQIEVAERAGMALAQYARIERGETNSALTLYAQIAQALDVPLSVLTDRV
ncbi:helix-turn-helix domain-containing protein [Pimelobacter simplex]|uniref:Uncharacterized protein n=1 Tax=Nocardioides simplex TaxID=2045 RepID=A0A0A1DH71_NOCSI|nr:helix-turn-helix transcriptional regulator [Pimelobacter simplex]AIY16696.1 hypothetical protein KR76_07815 [Pimelobacter simplex]MCG8154137.1 helix-turn-helix domain-containing protein [Pimelobacter simplex]GEB15544.1 hypothetical protein NSI01_38590 [Pimelobacter simplex]SFM58442.1 DNA-binding transcriptional regulator, XRE-family HTH domain [Pimelobacter simplex]